MYLCGGGGGGVVEKLVVFRASLWSPLSSQTGNGSRVSEPRAFALTFYPRLTMF